MKKYIVFVSIIFCLLSACSVNLPPSQTPLASPRPTTSPEVIYLPTLSESNITSLPGTPTPDSSATPIVSTVNPQQVPPGTIYKWDPPVGGMYLSIQPSSGLNSLQELIPSTPNVGSPEAAYALEFANYGPRVAYITLQEKAILWVSSPELTDVTMVWEDKIGWLSDFMPYQSLLDIKWGPGDNSLIVSLHGDNQRVVIYSFTSESAYSWEGSCDYLIQDVDGNIRSIGCKVQGEGTMTEIYRLDWEGSVQQVSPESRTSLLPVYEWAFAPTGDKVAFVGDDYSASLWHVSGEKIPLPIQWSEGYIYSMLFDDPFEAIHWSTDGARLLIHGFDTERAYCPTVRDSLTSNVTGTISCWLIIEGNTGEVIWWLTEDIIQEKVGQLWDGTSLAHDACFSPDGNWIAMSYRESGVQKFFIISTETNELIMLGRHISRDIQWFSP
jgi:WD40 repeat protein